MVFFTLFFLLGDLYLQTFTELPHNVTILSILIISFSVFVFIYKYIRLTHLGMAFILGYIWSAWYANSLLSWKLPREIEGQPLLAQGFIASIPKDDRFGSHFVFLISELKHESQILQKNIRVSLTWRENNLHLKVGDEWKLCIRLKRIHSTQNPGQFDFEAWALEQKLRASGSVIINKDNRFLKHHVNFQPIDQLRQQLHIKLQEVSSSQLHHLTWLNALIIGERSGATKEEWQILRQTGTNHLMAIAGLHIGLAAGIVNRSIIFVWKYFPLLALRIPAIHAGACGALVVAFLYSALAGFSIPTQRACIMLTVFILALLFKRQVNAWHVWSLALLIILVLNPLTILTDSFCLSFTTLALIIYGMQGRLSPRGIWWRWGRVQWIIGLGLIPMTQLLFHECSLIAFLANYLAIPWLAFLIMPFCFLAIFFIFIGPAMSKFFLSIADISLNYLWLILSKLSQLTIAVWHQPITTYSVAIITMLACVIILFPMGLPGRWLSLVWLLPMLSFKSAEIKNGDVVMSLLDVGQGLSVLIQTSHHILLYDTGAKFVTGTDMGETVILPYLQTLGISQIDKLIISHGDNDHIGGLNTLIKNTTIIQILSSVPEKIEFANKNYCLLGEHWQWDGVNFSFLYPTKDTLFLNNDSSCVLLIDNGIHKLLLTGDIEKYAERYLLTHHVNVSAEILIAPHHGSKTSGLKSFIQAVHPKVVLYATGYRNRYHFPHKSVIANYAEINAEAFNTATTGLMRFSVDTNPILQKPYLYRIDHKRYWYD